jgi:hypothetical protein
VLEPTKEKVLRTATQLEGKVTRVGPLLEQVTGEQFYNTSPLDLRRLLDDPNRIAENLFAYIADFSPAARDVLDKFDFRTHIERLDRANLLVERWFAELTTKWLKRGSHRSVAELEQAIQAWIETWNQQPRPFVWTKTADEILDTIAHYCQRINALGH